MVAATGWLVPMERDSVPIVGIAVVTLGKTSTVGLAEGTAVAATGACVSLPSGVNTGAVDGWGEFDGISEAQKR